MRAKGAQGGPSKAVTGVPATDDEIREKYLERAIRELNQLTRDIQSCELCPRGNLMPVLGSGHPQADIMLLKFAPMPSEIEEGVAFYGRAGSALMKSFKRLGIDPLAVYGTVFVKCPVADSDLSAPECRARVLEEQRGVEALPEACREAGLARADRALDHDVPVLHSWRTASGHTSRSRSRWVGSSSVIRMVLRGP